MNIRPYETTDRDDVRYICLNSDGPCDLDETEQFYVLTTFCDYYIEQEPENCFVAVDESDKAVGYILCSKDYDAFLPKFESLYLPKLDSLPENFRTNAKNSTLMQKKYKDIYPAHLHIDILPEYQRMGLGGKMMDALRAHLKAQGVPGVMLTVGIDNKTGRSFYEKYGFTVLQPFMETYAYGINT